uniref:Uncharacterized protein n=1 Tax=Steinernema glaseri TaxID=37863 RepID=A0A1I8A284_9BILA
MRLHRNHVRVLLGSQQLEYHKATGQEHMNGKKEVVVELHPEYNWDLSRKEPFYAIQQLWEDAEDGLGDALDEGHLVDLNLNCRTAGNGAKNSNL